MYEKNFKGTKTLITFIIRQQRLKLLIWLVSLVGINLIVARAYPNIYPDEESRMAAFMTMNNPAMKAMLGPGYELEDFLQGVGPLFANEMLLFSAIAVAIMSILLVGQTTRGDEEEGRYEMIHALSVGRLAHSSAVLIVNVATNLLLALSIGFGIALLGIESMDIESNLLYGAALGATGLIFASFTAVFAQLTESARTVTIYSIMTLMIAYLVRAIGDVSNETLSWFSPLGWTVKTGVFVENNWWPVILLCTFALFLGILAFYLHSLRDIGAGFIAPRKGKAYASKFLQTTLGFNIWLQKMNIIAWAIGLIALSGSFGAILGDLEVYFADIEIMEAYIDVESNYSLTEQFVALVMAIMTLIGVIPVVMTILKLKGEENRNLTENIYSRAVSRVRVLGSYVILAVIVSIIMQTMIALGLWSGSEAVMEEPLSFQTTFLSAYVYLPAIWVMTGLAISLLGVIPKLTSLIWFYFVYCFVVLYFSGLLDFPEWMNDLSIFEHIPQIPIDEMNVIVIIVLMMIAISFTVVGFVGYRKRDIIG